jgi:RNA-directed DNA polymerase
MQQLLDGKAGLVRYADDFVAIAERREQIEAIVPLVQDWLAERGLKMHAAKTRIVSVYDGFHFLGFHVKYVGGKCFFMPEKKKVLQLIANIRAWLKRNRSASAENVIRYLNPILRGWSNYYRHGVSKQTFAYVSNALTWLLFSWALRRHPNKGKDWVSKKYFGPHPKGAPWSFFATTIIHGERVRMHLYDVAKVPITRHIKVRGDNSPDDPDLIDYWVKREECKEMECGADYRARRQPKYAAARC